jgi:predicted nucleotide-binding protein
MASRKSNQPVPPERRVLTADDIERGITKLRRRIDEVNALDPNAVGFDDARVDNVESNIRTTVSDIFGPGSPEFAEHGHLAIWHGGYNMMDPPSARQQKFARGIPQTVTKLEGLVSRLEELRDDLPASEEPTARSAPTVADSRRVFIVHGREASAKEVVARFLAKLDLEPIILHEQANQGRTIIEKFEAHADVSFAIVLLTPDDKGALAGASELKPRARQNVIFEHGYFIGRLGRKHVCALYTPGVELPSDLAGVAYVEMDSGDGWRLNLARELRSAGINVDMNRAL